MGIDIHRCRDVLVSDTGCHCDGSKPVVDEQRHMGMTDVVDADLFDTGQPAASFQVIDQIILRMGKEPVVLSEPRSFDVIADLPVEQVRDDDISDAVFGLGRHDQVMAVVADVGLGDADADRFVVNVIRRESQQFADAHAGPVEDLKGSRCLDIIRQCPDEPAVFAQGPELHPGRVAASDMFCPAVWVWKVVICLRVFEDAIEIHVDGFEIGAAVGIGQQEILPGADRGRGDIAQSKLPEKRKDLVLNESVSGGKCGGFEPALHVGIIELIEILE